MAEEFQTGICPGIWWNSSRSSLGTSPCSVTLGDIGSFGWSSSADVMVARSNSTCDNPPQPVDSGGVLMDSTLQMLGFGLSPPSSASDWNNNQTLLEGGSERSEGNYNSMMQEDMNSRFNNYRQERDSHHHIQTNWLSKNFVDNNDEDDSTIDVFKPINLGFSTSSSSGDETATVMTCQGLPTSFPMSSYSSTLVQSLFVDDDHEPQHQQQQSSFDNNRSINNYQSSLSSNSNWPKVSPNFPKPSLPKQQQLTSNNHHLHFSNNTTYWNASAAAMNNDHIPASCFPSSQQSQFLTPSFEEKPNHANLTAKVNIYPNNEEVRDTGSLAKKSNNEPAFKRPRIETPSPLPTFKVRKEKLGDRITALQQLVSPFGKTDTASVLHEAIEYIKFLHDQVSVLSTPYMKNGSPTNNLQQHQQNSDKSKDSEGQKQDLRSRGLCLVPISSTLSTADFWTPTFGGTFR